MKHLIWYSSKTENYNHGSSIDLKISESLMGEKMEVLYEMEESEERLVRKIVSQLNNARLEKARNYQVA
ncbi:hypothetical protein [Marinoscillum sp. 108]|jgi:hypothetical protein|uniref:hypothetical protein n=1 Tax=Marinoscillum sp. 108 TaxID=2653151 RepID=UPI0012F2C5A7|nr:hypothetical protein [Marinoscillum sp. 108]VXD17522.1 conserved hypothetical protein [Marinoscillum sp. 108]